MLRFRAERACALAVALLAVTVVATTSAHAQQPTPTPTERQTSTITIRFVRDGEPVEVFFFSYPAGISADGVACQFPIPDGGVVGNQAHTEFSLPWPFLPIEGQPEECTDWGKKRADPRSQARRTATDLHTTNQLTHSAVCSISG